jgi:ATP-dependent Clp protease ATP-binding subunit ClpC
MEAERLSNDYIGTGHMLLGIIMEGGSVAAKVLDTLGVGSFAKVREEVEAIVGRGGQTVPQEMSFTPCAQRAIQFAAQEAGLLSHSADTGYLLLGLITETEGVATRVLTNLGIDPAEVRVQILNARE